MKTTYSYVMNTMISFRIMKMLYCIVLIVDEQWILDDPLAFLYYDTI